MTRKLRGERLETRAVFSVSPLGGEVLVNAFTPGSQTLAPQAAAIAPLASGGFAAVYSGRSVIDSQGVLLRQLAADGSVQGAAVQVNVTRAGDQQEASVAAAANGNFVVVWSGRGVGDHEGVFARLYNSSGTALTGEILVNSTTGGKQSQPVVAMSASGTFVVAWQGAGASTAEGIFVRRFDASGNPLAAEVQVDTLGALHPEMPALAVSTSGDFVVAWTGRPTGGTERDVFARHFSAAGVANGTEFRVNSSTSSAQTFADVAFASGGSYVVTWSSYTIANDFDVLARQFSSGDAAISGEIAVNDAGTGAQLRSRVTALSDGGFAVAWTSATSDASGWSVQVRQFSSAGAASDVAVQANATTAASQNFPDIALGADGNLLVAWNGVGSGDRNGVFARKFSTSTGERSLNLLDISDQEATVDEELVVNVSATYPGATADSLTFALDTDNAPAGATIVKTGPTTAQIHFTPAANQADSTIFTRVIVTDDIEPALVDTESFNIHVGPAPSDETPPAVRTLDLAPVPDQNATVGEELVVPVSATYPNATAESLTFALDADNSPAEATITKTGPTTAEIRFTPDESEVGTSILTRVIVTDGIEPALVDTESFQINVGVALQLTSTAATPTLELAAVPAQTATVEEELVVNVAATYSGATADSLTFALDADTSPAGATLEQTGPTTARVHFTPSALQAGKTFMARVTVTDHGTPALAAAETFPIFVAPAGEGEASDSLNSAIAELADALTASGHDHMQM